MIELARVDQWLTDTLTGDATLTGLVGGRIYNVLPPLGATYPFVVFNWQGGNDVIGVGTARIMINGLYQIKVIGQAHSGMAPIVAIADRVDTLLQGAAGSVVDGAILACLREQPISYVDTVAGEHFRHLGGLYRVNAQGI